MLQFPVLQFYDRAQDIWQAMHADAAAATRMIEFDQYIMLDDAAGRHMMELLAKKAEEGVIVRLLLDRVGSRQFYDHPLTHEIRRHGGEVTFYNSLGWFNIFFPRTWFPRNHVKAMLVDGKILHVGSACFADYMRDWHESHARLEDASAHGIDTLWGKALRGKMEDRRFSYRIGSPAHRHPIYRELLSRIRAARKTVYLVTPYFLAPIRLKRELRRAVRRGVDVRVMVSRKSDVPFASRVSHSYFNRVIKAGVKLYFYEPEMLHAKYALIDEEWAIVGSTNIDYLSLLVNRESNLVIQDAAAIMPLTARFLADIQNSTPVDRGFWRGIPLYLKLAAYAGRLLKKVI